MLSGALGVAREAEVRLPEGVRCPSCVPHLARPGLAPVSAKVFHASPVGIPSSMTRVKQCGREREKKSIENTTAYDSWMQQIQYRNFPVGLWDVPIVVATIHLSVKPS